jgi:hypothetical protein
MQSNAALFINPELSLADATESFRPYSELAGPMNGTVTIEELPSWLTFFNKYITGNVCHLPIPRFHIANLFYESELIYYVFIARWLTGFTCIETSPQEQLPH